MNFKVLQMRISIFFFLVISSLIRAQVNERPLIQLSGVVVTEEAFELPYTTVFNRSLNKGVVSDSYGFFSIVSRPGDTIFFSRKGYGTSPFIVPDSLTENRYSIIHMLVRDTLTLKEIWVYPWANKESFANYFVTMDPYEDDVRRAQRELSGESLAFVAARLDADPSLAHGAIQNQQYTKIYTNGQLPQNNFLNPYAWSKLIQDWKDGKLTRQ
ncbi:MAG: hypothetical protein RLZZ301_1728 [Bacteroidota bacterium]